MVRRSTGILLLGPVAKKRSGLPSFSYFYSYVSSSIHSVIQCLLCSRHLAKSLEYDEKTETIRFSVFLKKKLKYEKRRQYNVHEKKPSDLSSSIYCVIKISGVFC